MKRFLVLTLVLTMIFPAYSFASPQRGLPIEEDIINEVMWILEDGVIDETEINGLIAMYADKNNIEIFQQDNFICSIISGALMAAGVGLHLFGTISGDLPALVLGGIIVAITGYILQNLCSPTPEPTT